MAPYPRSLPSALQCLADCASDLVRRGAALFLDFDGTLAPFVPHPGRTALPEALRPTLRALAARAPVTIVSGRSRERLASLVGEPALHYAGDHGFDIRGPDGLRWEAAGAEALRPALEEVAGRLQRSLRQPGILVAPKRFSVAVHYPDEELGRIAVAAAAEAAGMHRGLCLREGRLHLEVQPDIGWHKGRAVEWLLRRLWPDALPLPIYLGDDLADEEAFGAVNGDGLAVLVGSPDRPTRATSRLEDPSEARRFLERLLAILDAGDPTGPAAARG